MAYEKQNFVDWEYDASGNVVKQGTTLGKAHLDHMEDGIEAAQAAADFAIQNSNSDYESVGNTPVTLTKGEKIKLVETTGAETSVLVRTPTVGAFMDDSVAFVNCEVVEKDGYYEFTVSDPNNVVTAFWQSYVERVFTGLIPGRQYTLIWDVDGLPYIGSDGGNIITEHHGACSAWQGDINGALIFSGSYPTLNGNETFTAMTDTVTVRYYPSRNQSNFKDIIGRFNNLYLNHADMPEDFTESYYLSDSFTGDIYLGTIPKGAKIECSPAAEVYCKSSVDDTLTESGLPADAATVGKRFKEMESYLPLFGKTIVNFGDSIFGNARPPEDISSFLAGMTGATVYNCGFGGCRMSYHESANYDAFSMTKLADAIAGNDFSVQDAAIANTDGDSIPGYFAESVELLKTIDFSAVDIVTIAYGTNDFNGVPLDNNENGIDTTSFGGALRYSIETILMAYPGIRIFVCSPTYRFWIDENNAFIEDTDTKANGLSYTTIDIVGKAGDIAKSYKLPFIDNYYSLGINKVNRGQYFPVNDGAHHNVYGRKLIAAHMAKELF